MNKLIKYFNKNYSKNNYIIENKKLDRYYTYDIINDLKETGTLKSEGLKEYGDEDVNKFCLVKVGDNFPNKVYIYVLADNYIYNGILYRDEDSYEGGYRTLGNITADMAYGYLIFNEPLINATITITKKNKNLTFPKINYPKSTVQIYKAYQTIKSYGIYDDKLNELLNEVRLPKPKSIEENELYTDCLYNMDDSNVYRIEKMEIFKDTKPIRKDPGGYGNSFTVFEGDLSNIVNPLYIIANIDYIDYSENQDGVLTNFTGKLVKNEYESTDGWFVFEHLYQNLIYTAHPWEEGNDFKLRIRSYDNSFFFYVKGVNHDIEKLTLTIYDDKSSNKIYSSQIYNINAEKLTNKEKGLRDYVRRKDAVISNSILLTQANIDEDIGEYNIGKHSCSFGDDATGDYSFSTGLSNSKGDYSFSTGETIANGDYQSTFGRYNIEDTEDKYVIIVGNGEKESYYSIKRSNAYTLDWKGNAWYKGNISIDGTPTNDKDLTTKKYVDDYLSPLVKKVGEATTQVAQEYVPTATTTYLNNMFNLVEVPITDSTLTLTSARNQTPTGGVMVDGTTIVLPEIDYFTEIHLFFKADANMNLTLPDIKYQMTTDIVGGKIYEFIFTHLNGLNEWIGGYVAYV